MNLVIHYQTDVPIYQQLYEQISAQIINGELKPNECLPAIRSVARELQISVVTVRSAWDMLENDGFIYTQAGRGCFVSEYTKSNLEQKKIDIATEQFQKDILFYRNLGITKDEFMSLVESEFSEKNI